MLRLLFIAASIFIGLSYGATCSVSRQLQRGIGDVVVTGKVMCKGQALYGAYVQLVDNFQAVNDVVGHGHTHHDGTFKVYGQYYYYADTDLAAAQGSWKIVVYSYCNIDNNRKNQCHSVFKQVVIDKQADGSAKCLELQPGSTADSNGLQKAKSINIYTEIHVNNPTPICLGN